MNRVWVVPCNDGEAVEIIALLREAGEHVLVSQQPWGASWAGLEPELRRQLDHQTAAPRSCQVEGVELAGPNPYGAANTDHHYYKSDDRRSPLSSLEQIAARLGRTLTRRQRLVAANDRGWVPAMRAEIPDASPDEIEAVRAQDRAAQGLTPADRLRAERDLAAADWRGPRVLVPCPDGTSSWHSDLLYGRAGEWLLAGPLSWSYSGPRVADFLALGLPEDHWAGAGFFGVSRPGAAARARLEHCFWTSDSRIPPDPPRISGPVDTGFAKTAPEPEKRC